MGLVVDIILQIKALKRALYVAISGLPDNPKIKRLGSGCFTIMSSDISRDRIWSPEYYDFRLQYEEIIKLIDKTPIEKIDKVFEDIFKTGFLYNTGNDRSRRYILHPEVIEHLKGLFKGV